MITEGFFWVESLCSVFSLFFSVCGWCVASAAVHFFSWCLKRKLKLTSSFIAAYLIQHERFRPPLSAERKSQRQRSSRKRGRRWPQQRRRWSRGTASRHQRRRSFEATRYRVGLPLPQNKAVGFFQSSFRLSSSAASYQCALEDKRPTESSRGYFCSYPNTDTLTV